MHPLKILPRLYLAGFIFSFQVALTIYINSSFLATKIPENLIGLLYTASAVLSIIGLFVVPKIMGIVGSRKTLSGLIILNILNILAMIFAPGMIIPVVGFVLFFTCNTLIYMGIDVVIEQYTNERIEGAVRGAYLTAMSAGYVVAPILAGYITERLGFGFLYGVGLFLIIPLIYLVIIKIPSAKNIHPAQGNILGLAHRFISNSHLRGVFVVNFLLQFFYAWMVIYTPIYLHEHVGISWDVIGILFTVMLTAFVIFQYLAGKIADRFHIEKHIMSLGLLIMGISTLFIIQAPTMTIVTLGLILFITRVGASLVEVMSESYFFKHVHHDDIGSIGFFRNTYPFAYIIAPIIATVIIRFTDIHYLFIILGILCILASLAVLFFGHLVPLKIPLKKHIL
jgi:MFS family permease